jgi:type IV secretion system protein TrbG
MITRLSLLRVAVLGALTIFPAINAVAQTATKEEETGGFNDAKIVRFAYDENRIVRVLTRLQRQTHIALQDGEVLTQAPIIGDNSRWKVSGGPTHLFIKPLVAGTDTTMTLVTNKRTYQLHFTSATQPEGAKFYQRIGFDYPADDAKIAIANQAAIVEAQRAKSQVLAVNEAKLRASEIPEVSAVLDPTKLACAYEVVSGDKNLARFFCDTGTHTLIRVIAGKELPAIFAKDASGQLTLVNFTLRDEMLVVGRVSDEWELRLDNVVTRVIKKGVKKSWFGGSRAVSGEPN